MASPCIWKASIAVLRSAARCYVNLSATAGSCWFFKNWVIWNPFSTLFRGRLLQPFLGGGWIRFKGRFGFGPGKQIKVERYSRFRTLRSLKLNLRNHRDALLLSRGIWGWRKKERNLCYRRIRLSRESHGRLLPRLRSSLSINMSGFVATLELRYLSKGRSEFGTNNIIRKIKCDVIQGICKLKVELLNWVGGWDTRFLKSHRPLAHF